MWKCIKVTASSRFIIKNNIFTWLFLDKVMRMYGYHDNGFITWTTSFCTNLLFQSILVYKNVRIKIHLHQLKRHIKKHIQNLVKYLRWNFLRNKLTDLQKAHIRSLTQIPFLKYFCKNLYLRCLRRISPIFTKSSILDVWVIIFIKDSIELRCLMQISSNNCFCKKQHLRCLTSI